ncbi:hypothetical protein CcaverHIS002_0300940 [Cutaneotrichosporon cavernicola]|uniref:Uncharacterized protein n=1 Tax=Cutaneotrichosporon cavernicola TaxID=279322 RepID=A0AA48L0K7_9TREE|nr:uncharacterized protein CcaverHIS019_0300910 [Cutaneotrichosporon cavernicola]BEI82226.1 hypothetical protein CcaverHIS002_0300940 [Cutaneotrichosporon cavernicola]BEI90021.1 hypothetical protein CcaverHIS019_0300910 [Cutaneotrichosporon cavernicola]BEI97795.1 hypothetical protein CcaverHIS631_0300940 [Cutaneotrichosporon cavernicola]BEJ05572.1 hypothetical protein CcaverHIS641_0300940 [Cutaneotrichosporon cavernicola]
MSQPEPEPNPYLIYANVLSASPEKRDAINNQFMEQQSQAIIKLVEDKTKTMTNPFDEVRRQVLDSQMAYRAQWEEKWKARKQAVEK